MRTQIPLRAFLMAVEVHGVWLAAMQLHLSLLTRYTLQMVAPLQGGGTWQYLAVLAGPCCGK